MARQIVAMGGGGFSAEPDNPLLDAYVIALAGKERPKVCFLPTASGDAQGYVYRFHRRFKKLTGKRSSHLGLTPPTKPDLAAHLLAQDVIYVGGGNTAAMLSTWRDTGVDAILREAYERGIVLAGVSAGAICWFDWGLTDSVPGTLTPLACLGMLRGSASPHYDTEADRQPAFRRLIATGALPPGIGIDDGVALHYVDGELHRVVSSRPAARACRVAARDGVAQEQALPATYLGGQATLIRKAVLADAPGIALAHHRSIREIAAPDYTAEQIQAWTYRQSAEAVPILAEQIASDHVWVIEMAGTVEGYVHLRTPMEIAPIAYLHALYVTPSAARQGLGKRLMALAELEAARRGHPSIQLHSSRTALGFYVAVGYRRSGPPMLHAVQGVGLECFPMVKDLKRSEPA